MQSKSKNRKSIRLKGYDYSQSGAYFITICTKDKECILGEIKEGEVKLNEYGRIVWDEWFHSEKIRNEIQLSANEIVIMPNHIHGIVWIKDTKVGANGRSPLQYGLPKRSISSFIAGFKSTVTKQINQIRRKSGTAVWQRNYYEHIVRDENELNKIREYIKNNPIQWELDIENPRSKKRYKDITSYFKEKVG